MADKMGHTFQHYSYGPPSSSTPMSPISPNTSSPHDHQQHAISPSMADPRSYPYAAHHQTYDSPYQQNQHQHHHHHQQPQQHQYSNGNGNGNGHGSGNGEALTLPSMSAYGGPPTMDTTGQIAPPGMRPRLTTSVFEEEGSLCFQVDVGGVCVARRDDNHMINGTKLLNVAGMTRGRRDGILKAEKNKNVVKIGPMHLKGVWIPFERALVLANQEKITERLYPLFVHNIGSLLYHPINLTRPPPLPQPGSFREELPPMMRDEGDVPRRVAL